MTIVLRLTKGSPLSHAELDGNFTDLDDRVTPLESAPPAHTHTESDITDLSHDAVSLLGQALDATVGSPSDGDILVFRDLGSDWVLESKPAGASPNVNDLGDVTITSVGDNELLSFDSGSGDWINQTAAELGLSEVGHTHALVDITDSGALAALDTVDTLQIDAQAVTLDKIVDQGGITPGAYTAPNLTVSQEGIITAISSGSASSGGLSTVDDANTSIIIGDANTGTHRRLTADTAITLTLDAQGSVGTKVAVTPKGAGVVTVGVEAGATYELPLDNDAARTASFIVNGYVLFEVVANGDGDSAVWDIVGETDHADTADNDIDFSDKVVSRPELKDYAETRTAPGSSAGVLTLDMENGNCFEVTLTENVTTLTLANPPASGKVGTIFLIVKQDGTGGWTLAWPASVEWPGGTAPTISSAPNAKDIYSLVVSDGGTTWYGFTGGQDFS